MPPQIALKNLIPQWWAEAAVIRQSRENGRVSDVTLRCGFFRAPSFALIFPIGKIVDKIL